VLATIGRTYSATGRTALRPRNVAPQPTSTAMYDAGGGGRRALGWWTPGLMPNSATLGSLQMLRDRSRAGVRNDGVAKALIGRLVTNIIGTGMRPLSQAPDGAFRLLVQRLWASWVLASDPEGLLSFYGQQTLGARAWLEGGEVFVRLRARLASDGLPVPLQLQIIEPEFCPITWNNYNGDNRIRAGVEFNPIGRRVAYWMWRHRPGDLVEIDKTVIVRVPAEGVLHLYDVLRPGQIRGLPHLTQALVRLYDLDQYDDATLIRAKLANMYAGFVTTPTTPVDGNGNQVDPQTGQPVNLDSTGHAVIQLEPGMFAEMRPGEEVEFNDPPAPGGRVYLDFMRQQLRSASVAADVPYEVLTGDMTGVNDRTARIILNEFRRRIEQWQHQLIVDRFCRPTWEAFFDRAVVSGALPVPPAYYTDPKPWRQARWQADRWPYIQPVQDIDALRNEVRSGVKSQSMAIVESGADPEEVFAQIAADNRRMDELGIVLDTDPRKTGRQGNTQAKAVGPGGEVVDPPDDTPPGEPEATPPA
jgi:lambda family phage portal protein